MAEDKHWHVERKIPIAILGGLALQALGLAWWLSGLGSRVDGLERADLAAAARMAQVETRQFDSEKLAVRVDEQLKTMRETLARVESALRAAPPAAPAQRP